MPGTIDLSFALGSKQRRFVESTRSWSAFMGGVGGGKTYSGAVKSILAALQEPGSLGIIAAPSYTMLRDTSQRKFFELLPQELIKNFNKNEEHLWITNGSEVIFRSTDNPDKIRGVNASWGWLDEGPYAGYYAWQLLKQRVGRQNKHRFRRQAWITGTPKGRDGYWKEFVLNPTKDHLFVQSSTRENLRNLPDDYIEGLGFTGSFYMQEIEGSFEAYEGLVYAFNTDENDPQSHVQPVPDGKIFRRIFGGIDWGYTNPAVALVFGVDNDLRVWQLAEYYQRQVRLDDMLGEVLELTQRYGVEDWWCDPAEPEHVERLSEKIDSAMLPCNVWAAENAIVPGIQTVSRFLQLRGDGMPGFLMTPDCVNTQSEFLSYQYDKKLYANETDFVKEKPKTNQADHAMDAVRYALHNEFGLNRSVASASTHMHAQQPTQPPENSPLQQMQRIIDENGEPVEEDDGYWWSLNPTQSAQYRRRSDAFSQFLEKVRGESIQGRG